MEERNMCKSNLPKFSIADLTFIVLIKTLILSGKCLINSIST